MGEAQKKTSLCARLFGGNFINLDVYYNTRWHFFLLLFMMSVISTRTWKRDHSKYIFIISYMFLLTPPLCVELFLSVLTWSKQYKFIYPLIFHIIQNYYLCIHPLYIFLSSINNPFCLQLSFFFLLLLWCFTLQQL